MSHLSAAFGGRLNCAIGNSKQNKLLADILDFVGRTSGLKDLPSPDDLVGKKRIHQALDNKFIDFAIDNLEEVLLRSDTEGQEFIQVNFCTGQKILLTDTLIGFKPVVPKGLDASKLPRVVTTPDIASVFEAIQDALDGSSPDIQEVQVLRRVFDAVISGGEAVGFDLSTERSWILRIPSNLAKLAS